MKKSVIIIIISIIIIFLAMSSLVVFASNEKSNNTTIQEKISEEIKYLDGYLISILDDFEKNDMETVRKQFNKTLFNMEYNKYRPA